MKNLEPKVEFLLELLRANVKADSIFGKFAVIKALADSKEDLLLERQFMIRRLCKRLVYII